MIEESLKVDNEYSTDQIDSLEGLEAVRKRPGMYIGSTSQKGVTHLIWEVADNCFDEAVAGYGKDIYVHVGKDTTVTISDKGRGIPVGPHHKWKDENGNPQDTLTGILTRLHAGGKFNAAGSGYKVSSGLHGVGTKAVNALSKLFVAVVRRNGKIYQQKFSKGKPITPVEVIGTCDINDTGTTIIYTPDDTIFKITTEPNCKDIQNRLNELASLNGGIEVKYHNEITNVKAEYKYDDGILGYVKRMIEGKNTLYDNPIYLKDSYEIDEDKIIMVEIALSHLDNTEPIETIKTFANNINTYEGGFHLKGFRDEYKNQLNKFGLEKKLIVSPIELKYLLDGVQCIVSVKVPEAEFEGQTKTKLGNSEAQTAVEKVMEKFFSKALESPEIQQAFEAIVIKAQNVKEAEEAARKARANKRKANKANKMSLPGKLSDCSNKNGYTELFLVEGDSAAGSAKSGRYREFQAILPLRGKVLNTEKSTFDKMINSDAIKNIIAAIGAGVGPTFDVEKSRYDKIIIMCDADDDGAHIKTLLLTFMFKYMKPLFDKKMVYSTLPPLYRIKKGKDSLYLKDDTELKEFKKKNKGKYEVQRFKGLGEMMWQQLKETTMDPQSRTLKLITIEDMERAIETFDICMGNKASARREFVESNANRVEFDL